MWLRISVSDDKQTFEEFNVQGAVMLGRQQSEQEPFPSLAAQPSGPQRLVIAPRDRRGVSREHVLLNPLGGGHCSVENVGKVKVVVDGEPLAVGAARNVRPPSTLQFGNHTLVRIEAPVEDSTGLESLAEEVVAPFSQRGAAVPQRAPAETWDAATMLRWITNSIDVFQSAATSDDFFQHAARATVETIGLECGRVLLRQGNRWQVKAIYQAPHLVDEQLPQPSMRVLARVVEEKDTFWELPAEASIFGAHSLLGVAVVVAAPILDRDGEVIGVLYGDRRNPTGGSSFPSISRLDAMLVRLLACAVAAGLARLHEEELALTARGRFEQFFTPELSRYLAANPDLVETSRDCEVTVLICDVRSYSRISERVGLATTSQWLNAVMDALSLPVREYEGVLVDYVGDEVCAMWGAPAHQPDHAARACRAALDMMKAVPALSAQWEPTLGEPVEIGIGINTGKARVGNTGSRYKFKYGPMGNTVNLTSRVQGATKYLRTPCLLAQSTFDAAGAGFSTRRICRVRVQNIEEPVTLHELALASGDRHRSLKRRYETALDHFEQGDFVRAAEMLGGALAEFPDDGPTRVLLKRVADVIARTSETHDAIWELPGK